MHEDCRTSESDPRKRARRRSATLPLLFALPALAAAFLVAGPAEEAADPSTVVTLPAIEVRGPEFHEAWADFMRETERNRIRRHLAYAEAGLRARGVSDLTPEQRANRERHIAVLAEYRERGVFPRNPDFDQRVPYFVDDRGVHCAVGYLLHRDGEDALVQRIAATRNHATVHELADEPGLAEWLEGAGLTLGEAARIQPKYGPCWGRGPECELEEPVEDPALSTGHLAASGLTALVGVGTLWLNRGGAEGRIAPAAGLVAGAAGIGAGAAGLDEGGWNAAVGAAGMAFGAAVAWRGYRALSPAAEAGRSADPVVGVDHRGRVVTGVSVSLGRE